MISHENARVSIYDDASSSSFLVWLLKTKDKIACLTLIFFYFDVTHQASTFYPRK